MRQFNAAVTHARKSGRSRGNTQEGDVHMRMNLGEDVREEDDGRRKMEADGRRDDGAVVGAYS